MPCSLPRWIDSVLRFWSMMRSRIGLYPKSLWPSLNEGQVGVHNFPFEACSSFTRVTACRLAHPPFVSFVTSLPSRRLSRHNGPSAIQSYRQLLEWDFHPLVICALRGAPSFRKNGTKPDVSAAIPIQTPAAAIDSEIPPAASRSPVPLSANVSPRPHVRPAPPPLRQYSTPPDADGSSHW